MGEGGCSWAEVEMNWVEVNGAGWIGWKWIEMGGSWCTVY